MQNIKALLILSTLTGLFLGVGYLAGGRSGMTIALLLSFAMNIGSYWFSHKMVLAMHRARELTRNQAPELFTMTEEMSNQAGIPMPKLYIFDDPSPNAFATGRNPETGVVAVSTGILGLLSQEELRGVVAHELAHIKNRDLFLSTVAASLAGALSFLVEMGFGLFSMFLPRGEGEEGPNPLMGIALMIVTPIIGLLIQMALSRSREYYADETGAKIAGETRGLSHALQKLAHWSLVHRNQLTLAPRSEAVQHLYIFNHFQGIGAMFSTHPPIEERIKRLQKVII